MVAFGLVVSADPRKLADRPAGLAPSSQLARSRKWTPSPMSRPPSSEALLQSSPMLPTWTRIVTTRLPADASAWRSGDNQGENRRQTGRDDPDRKSTRLNSSHLVISYAVFCLKKKK